MRCSQKQEYLRSEASARGDIKTFLFSISISIPISISVYCAVHNRVVLRLSKLHSLLEMAYHIKKDSSRERRCIVKQRGRGGEQGERNSINPCFRFSPRYYVIYIFTEIGKFTQLFLLFRKSRKETLSRFVFSFCRNLPISKLWIRIRIKLDTRYRIT